MTHKTIFDDDSDIILKKYISESKYDKIKREIDNEMTKRNICIQQIYDLQNVTIDDYIWFTNNIKLRDEMQNSEEKIELSNKIYKKYKDLNDLQNTSDAQTILQLSPIDKISSSNFSDNIKKMLYQKYKMISDTQQSDEYAKWIEWIDTILKIPTRLSKTTFNELTINSKMANLYTSLNNQIYGLNTVKEKIMETMCHRLLNSGGGKILTLIGPPGVGKTSIASVIANSIDMPFDHISCGSLQDPQVLTGHSPAYIGSSPSLLTKILIKSQRLDVVVLLDEIDKITNISIITILIHLLDKSQNNNFKDMYCSEIPIDFSEIIFICTANSVSDINPILRDRMTIVNLCGYTLDDKINITKTFFLPKLKKELRFADSDIIMEDDEIKYLILNKTIEQAGMRNIEGKMRELFDRLALLKYGNGIKYSFSIDKFKLPLKITKQIINKLV
jgi:ATP-dependent Lon protease